MAYRGKVPPGARSHEGAPFFKNGIFFGGGAFEKGFVGISSLAGDDFKLCTQNWLKLYFRIYQIRTNNKNNFYPSVSSKSPHALYAVFKNQNTYP